MKKLRIASLSFLTMMGVSSAVFAHVCVGGPRFPFYAYESDDDAQACARVVASFSRACAEAVRVAPCVPFAEHDAPYVPPGYCVCGQGVQPVGTWR